MGKLFYTVDEITKFTGLGRTKVYEEINSNALKANKCGARTLVSAESFAEWSKNLKPYVPSREV